MQNTNANSTHSGRVVTHFGAQSMVETPAGDTVLCDRPRRLLPVCGDYVIFKRQSSDQGVLVAINPRENEFPRVDTHGRPRTIAANLQRVIIVLAPEPAPTRLLVDRYLIAASTVGVAALLLLNKSDLPGHPKLLNQLQEFADLGYPLISTAAKAGTGMTDLRRELCDGTSILAGQSGVGKSRVAQALLPDKEIVSRALSNATGKGRHTTTNATLYHLPGGGELIDTPGVWEYGLWRIPQADIEYGFVEFRPSLGQCRFRDCRHTGEPGCAVDQAVKDGAISQRRLAAYRQILSEL